MFRRALVAIVAVPLAVLTLACGVSTGSSTSAGAGGGNGVVEDEQRAVSTVKAGETLELVEDFLGSKTRVSITLSNVRYNAKSSSQYDKPKEGQFIVADVAVLVNEGKFSISGGSFKLVAADGTAYNTTYMTGLKSLDGQDVTPGQKTAGSIAFDAAKNAQTGGKIALTNMLAEGDAGYWAL